MSELYSFVRSELLLRRAASAGTMTAAEVLAGALRSEGWAAQAESRLDGTAAVALEGAAAVAREFGTTTSPARPVLGPTLHANRPRLIEAVSRTIGGAISGGRI